MRAVLFFFLTLFLCSCRDSRDSRTFYLNDDGTVDLVYFSDNIHFGQKPEDRKEEKEWLVDFNAGKSHLHENLKKGNAKKIKSILIKKTAPYSAIVAAEIPSFQDLIHYFNMSDEVEIELKKDKNSRQLIFHVLKKSEAKNTAKKETAKSHEAQVEHSHAIRFIPKNATITNAMGFLIEESNTTCQLDWNKVNELESQKIPYSIFCNWQVN